MEDEERCKMSFLPKNEMKIPKDTPRNFFIWGPTMAGKSYLAGEFPNPLFLNTDGNAEANPYPSIQLRNIRGKDGKIEEGKSIIDQLDGVVTELQTKNHGFETIVLDVIDDVVIMIEQYICDKFDVETVGDVPYGKGYGAFTNIFQQLVIELKALPFNIIYVSRNLTKSENNVEIDMPSLKEKHQNVVNGNCDLNIQCKKVGKNYIRSVKAKRKNYLREEIDNKEILTILDSITGVFDRSQRVNRQIQDEIVKKIEENENPIKEEKEVPVTEEKKATEKVAEPTSRPRPSGRIKPVV